MTLEELTEQFLEHQHNNVDGTLKLPKTVFVSTVVPSTTAASTGNYGTFFIAPRPCYVKSLWEVHGTAGSVNATLQIERLQGTESATAGDLLLATAFALTATANTVQEGALVSDKTLLSLNQGERLALRPIGTYTSVNQVVVTVELEFK